MHVWECDCGRLVRFRQPELSDNDPNSEQNRDKNCPDCGEPMYFDEIDFDSAKLKLDKTAR